MTDRPSPPEPLRAEIDRLRQILWEIAQMTGYEGTGDTPPVGVLDPDVPELALDSVKAYCAEYLSYTTPQGSDINPAAGPDSRCSRCGQAITMLAGRWLHLYNEQLTTGERHAPRAPANIISDSPRVMSVPVADEEIAVSTTAVSADASPDQIRRLSQQQQWATEVRRLGRRPESAEANPYTIRQTYAVDMGTYTYQEPSEGDE